MGAGRYVRIRNAYLAALVAHAGRLEADRDEQARQAVVDERRRIARELHDQVAHHLGVVSLQTGAARRWLDRDRDGAVRAIASAEQASRTALETMPVILQALRGGNGDGRLGPRPAVELAAYRVVQEVLTNTLEHAGPASATVRLRYGARSLTVSVDDDGHGAGSPDRDGANLGLLGMRERVELLGGRLAAGPREGGGFTVRAELPASGLGVQP